jgi:dephospho-CoA kinase
MLKLGITGGIGSGKTTVCRIFETLGIPVYYADERAKWLMINDPELVANIKKLLGEDAYFDDGRLNRKYIAGIVFSNEEKLAQLNALVHPAVGKDGEQWHAEQKNVPYTLKEAAILFESKSHLLLDKVINVSAPMELRIARVMVRDGVDRSTVEARIKEQMSEEERIERSDYVIYNDGSRSLVEQVVQLHRLLCEMNERLQGSKS